MVLLIDCYSGTVMPKENWHTEYPIKHMPNFRWLFLVKTIISIWVRIQPVNSYDEWKGRKLKETHTTN
jgi:hypothetical protein